MTDFVQTNRPQMLDQPSLILSLHIADSEIVMVDLGFGHDSFEQDRPWDDFGTIISGI